MKGRESGLRKMERKDTGLYRERREVKRSVWGVKAGWVVVRVRVRGMCSLNVLSMMDFLFPNTFGGGEEDMGGFLLSHFFLLYFVYFGSSTMVL
ncbi:hypothetical protein V6N13_031569 [Hibiscus sabdariffa]